MKYIVTRQENGTEEIFVFPRAINHDCMAEGIARLRSATHGDWHRVTRTPISAGFIDDGKCVGLSESLQLESRPQDTDLLGGLPYCG